MLKSLTVRPKPKTIIAIDPASHSLAWAVFDIAYDDIKLIDNGKIEFGKIKDISGKFAEIKKHLTSICSKYKPVDGVIEQSVYIQNFQSSRIISYIIGFSWGVLDQHCSYVTDVNPLSWKSGIGYKNVTKNDKLSIEKEFGAKNIQARLKDERKERVRVIVEKNLGWVSDDSDINDALGIGLWYIVSNGYRTLQR